MATGTILDREIKQDVLDELDWDPEVEVTDVGVEVDDGVVTLTGTVDSYAKKYAAEQAVFRVDGVRAVANDIVVQPGGLGYRSDTEIAKAVADALELDVDVPAEHLRIRVANGAVTLQGEVAWYYQRVAAEDAVRKLPGVVSVLNLIEVAEQPVTPQELRESIERAFLRNAAIDADAVQVEVDGGHVTLYGKVRSLAERRQAEEVAWKGRGVTRVTNHIRVVLD